MVSISVPSWHSLEQASISYHNPIVVLSRPISLSASQSETLLPVWFVQPVPVLSYRPLWHVPMSTLTLLNWNHCYQAGSPQSQEVMLWTHGLRDGYKSRWKKKKSVKWKYTEQEHTLSHSHFVHTLNGKAWLAWWRKNKNITTKREKYLKTNWCGFTGLMVFMLHSRNLCALYYFPLPIYVKQTA